MRISIILNRDNVADLTIEQLYEAIYNYCKTRKDGGKGSGNFGHSGRPGEVGGSASESSGGSKSTERRKKWKSEVDSKREAHKSMKGSRKAIELTRLYGTKQGDEMYSKILSAFKAKDGSLDNMIDDYYDLLEENGDTEPAKTKTGQVNDELYNKVASREFGSYEEARKAYIKEWTGQSDREVGKSYEELNTWFSSRWSHADTKTLDKYIDDDHVYDGEMYRGLHFDDSAQFDDFIKQASTPGAVIASNKGMNQSWSSNEEVARTFAHTSSSYTNSVLIKCLKNKTSAPVDHLSYQGEGEIISHSKTQWTVLRTEVQDIGNGARNAYVYVIEKEDRST